MPKTHRNNTAVSSSYHGMGSGIFATESFTKGDGELTRVSDSGFSRRSQLRNSHRLAQHKIFNDTDPGVVDTKFQRNIEIYHDFDDIDKLPNLQPEVMEKWLVAVLEEAEHLEIPGVIKTYGKSPPLNQYGLDRKSLNDYGCKRDQVNRLYRSIFVYSIGFFQVVKDLVQDTKNSFVLSSSIWKIYLIILEY